MNNLLMLQKDFESKSAAAPTHPTIPAKAEVSANDMRRLARSLRSAIAAWPKEAPLQKMLISVEYRKIAAKSNRIKRIFAEGAQDPEVSIRGARYDGSEDSRHHVITHYVSRDVAEASANELELAAILLKEHFGGHIDKKSLDNLWDRSAGNTNESWKKLTGGVLSRINFARLIHDTCHVAGFDIPRPPAKEDDVVLTTLYRTDGTAYEMLQRLGIDVLFLDTLGDSAVLKQAQYRKLYETAPYLIAMSTFDMSQLDAIDVTEPSETTGPLSIGSPSTEPTIGVIDTPFDTEYPPYFSEWVDVHNELPGSVLPRSEDYVHGTCVTSLIVNGHMMNPGLDDGCGCFRVRHFGIAPANGLNSFVIARKIKDIVEDNPDIHVWNLSLGSDKETERFCISPEAEVLDKLQSTRNVLFVVAATNNKTCRVHRIGAPADSVNSLVVSSVRPDGTPASYSRSGPVLDFYRKPDVAYYGGDNGCKLSACCGTGEKLCMGTSYAAPLIARKAAFLIDVMGIPRDAAKALLIDSASGWRNDGPHPIIGHGIVPVDIHDVLEAPNNEIRFFLTGTANTYETYNYGIPVPVAGNAFPYLARAVLCYAPKCDRNQGVDYTSTELDLHFGRLRAGGVASIKLNTQGEKNDRTTEKDARDFLGKWDNVKRICDKIPAHPRARKIYDMPAWGIKIRKTSRLSMGDPAAQPFGLVATLREINNANRIDSFVQHCVAEGWMVRAFDVDTQIRIFNAEQVEIEFE